MVKDLRNKFSLDMNIGLLGLKFSVIITLKGGGISENFSFLASSKIFFSNENFLLDSDSLIVEDSMKK